MNTKLRNGELGTLQLLLQHTLQRFVSESEDGVNRSCLNCQNFDEKGVFGAPEVCRLVNVRPPARIIAFGCPSHTDTDCIPF